MHPPKHVPGIPLHVLVVSERLGPGLDAAGAAAALADGLVAGGAPAPDLCPLVTVPRRGANAPAELARLLDAAGLHARMLASRAVVIAVRSLAERTLVASLAFEVATRARQSGVPCYAVTANNRLDSFDARILDLQAVLEAATPRELERAGRELAAIV